MKWQTLGIAAAIGLSALPALRAAAEGGAAEKRQMLARHETIAEFLGTRYHRCLGLTSACPDRCGQSGTMASFRIVEYTAYEKPGEYGDPKAGQYDVLVEDNRGNLKVPPAIRDAVRSLKPGDRVRPHWNHDYVTKDGSSYPERPIVRLEKIAP